MNNEEFYSRVGEILGIGHDYVVPKRKTRWGPRNPGNGRYEGFGTVRVYGNKVHISLRSPKPINVVVDSKEAAVSLLKSIVGIS